MRSLSASKRIFIVHPTLATVASLKDALVRLWPEAKAFNLIDESLYDVLDAKGTITPQVRERVKLAMDYCVDAGADAIIFNGVTFGPAIDEARTALAIPVLKPVEAMAEQAVSIGTRIAILCSSKRSIAVVRQVIQNAAQGNAITVTDHFVEGAQAALLAGDIATHDELVAATADTITDCDVLLLAQTPMVSALPRLNPCANRQVLTTPDGTVIRLKALLC
jgi:Asp/Glu/hydantoin racemase